MGSAPRTGRRPGPPGSARPRRQGSQMPTGPDSGGPRRRSRRSRRRPRRRRTRSRRPGTTQRPLQFGCISEGAVGIVDRAGLGRDGHEELLRGRDGRAASGARAAQQGFIGAGATPLAEVTRPSGAVRGLVPPNARSCACPRARKADRGTRSREPTCTTGRGPPALVAHERTCRSGSPASCWSSSSGPGCRPRQIGLQQLLTTSARGRPRRGRQASSSPWSG